MWAMSVVLLVSQLVVRTDTTRNSPQTLSTFEIGLQLWERESFQFGLSGTALAWRNSNGNLKIICPILSQLYALGLCSSLNCITRYWNISPTLFWLYPTLALSMSYFELYSQEIQLFLWWRDSRQATKILHGGILTNTAFNWTWIMNTFRTTLQFSS